MVEFEEVELDLGLSIGGAFKKPVEKSKPEFELESGLNSGQKMDQKREIQALRRMEAKRKREQKKGSGNRVGESEPEVEHEPECEPVFKKEKKEFVNGGVSWMAPFQQFGGVQFVPLNNGVAFPYWFGSEKNVGGIDGVSFNGGDGKVRSNGSNSSRCSSSAVSDYQSSSREDGGSTDSHSRSHSANSFAEPTQLKICKQINITKNKPEEIASSQLIRNHNNVKEPQIHPNNMQLQQIPMKLNEQETIPVPIKKALPQMPYVSTKGNGPNGKTVNGFLYRYSKCDEVSIVCVCHGSTFSPAEFVQHAGGTDITHPLRHITVNSSAFG